MYGPNYSGFAFHPKAVRMVGSVHFGDLSVLRRRIRGAKPAPATLPARRQHIVTPVQKIRLPGNFTWNTYPFDACAPHGNLDGTPCATAPPSPSQNFGWLARHLSPVTRHNIPACETCGSHPRTMLRIDIRLHRASDCFRGTYPPVTSRRVSRSHLTQKQKRRVSRETRRPFPAYHATDQAVFFTNPRYVSITRGFCASSAAGPSSANSPVSST